MSSFYQAMDMMRNVSNDSVKRVYSEDSGMGSILETESLMSVGGPSSSSSTGLFNSSPRAIPMDMNKEERFSRKVFVGGLPPDIDEGNTKFSKTRIKVSFFFVFNRRNYCTFSKIWSINC